MDAERCTSYVAGRLGDIATFVTAGDFESAKLERQIALMMLFATCATVVDSGIREIDSIFQARLSESEARRIAGP